MVAIPTSEKRPFIPAVGVMQVEMVYTYLAQKCENVYHALVGSGGAPPTTAQMTALAAAMESVESTTLRLHRSSGATLTLIRVRDLSSQGAPAVERAPTTNVTGSNATQPMPGNVTIAVKWSTGLSGRSYRGRTFHIGLTADRVQGDVIDPTYIAALKQAYLAVRDGINGLTAHQMVVLSYAHNNFWRNAALATPVVDNSINGDLDSQRRRLKGRGQ